MRFLLFALIVALAACAKEPEVLFCEGTKPDGSTVNCGTSFSVGDLMAVYKTKKYPDAEKFDFTVYEVSKGKKQRIDSVSSSVKAGSKIATADISLYNIGEYEIEVSLDGNVIAKSSLNVEEGTPDSGN
ncbi:MAG: hypothetical protein FWG13_04500 [Leptospirales bacterium]|nr:hypothetical protein [Leptospirales bacterium]